MNQFQIYPAIDLRQGQVVRLKQGDPDRQTVYDLDPAAVAERWLSAGANWLHVVNLDGAFGEGDSANHRALQAILPVAARYHAQIQFGGGIRSLEAIKGAFALGIARLALGTLIVEQPEVLRQALHEFGPEHLVAGIDARNRRVQVRGWQQAASISAEELAVQMAKDGLRWLIFTDVDRDGLGRGLNIKASAKLARLSGLKVIASGGVATLDDIVAARAAGLAGVIVGRALYEGKISITNWNLETIDPSEK